LRLAFGVGSACLAIVCDCTLDSLYWTRSASYSCMRSLKLGHPILLRVSHIPSPGSAVGELFVGLIITMELDVIWRRFCASDQEVVLLS
jgi:hypothetical protein